MLIGVVVPTTDHTRPPNTELVKFAHWKLDLAIPLRGSKAAAFKWMEQPNSYLDGERPIELAESVEGANRVLEYIRNYIAQHAPAPDEQNGSWGSPAAFESSQVA